MIQIGQLTIDDQAIAAFCQRHGIRRLAFFGSVLRDDFGPDSDVDVLLEFEPGTRMGFNFSICRMNSAKSSVGKLISARQVRFARHIETESSQPQWTSMSQRDDQLLIQDMLEHATLAIEATRTRSRQNLDEDRVFRAASERFVEIVGEAAGRISVPTKQQFPNVPWQDIIGTRNYLAHGYAQIDLDVLWNILTTHLPLLVAELESQSDAD